jgi:hypothetical protein
MDIPLTADQQQLLDTPHDTPPRVFDARHNQAYVLIPAEQYERLRALLEGTPLAREEQLYFLREAGRRAGWDEPEMDIYNDLDPRRKP